MELFPAADEDSWTLIRRLISECDYYIAIVAGRYGSTHPTSAKGYTEMEYEFALEAGIPTLAFLHEDPGKLAAERCEETEAGKKSLQIFRATIESRRQCKYWTSTKDLGGVVSRGIATLMKNVSRVGWVRADMVLNESAAQEMLRLRERIDELELTLEHANAAPPLGAEELAQGDETVALRFRYEAAYGNYATTTFDFTWNSLLVGLGPHLLKPISESEMKAAIKELWSNRTNQPSVHAYILEEDFQKVKIQFRALGIIDSQPDANWMLTPYGDRMFMKRAAIRSQTNADGSC